MYVYIGTTNDIWFLVIIIFLTVMTYIGVLEEMFETGDVRDQASQALLEVFVKESVHDRIRAD